MIRRRSGCRTSISSRCRVRALTIELLEDRTLPSGFVAGDWVAVPGAFPTNANQGSSVDFGPNPLTYSSTRVSYREDVSATAHTPSGANPYRDTAWGFGHWGATATRYPSVYELTVEGPGSVVFTWDGNLSSEADGPVQGDGSSAFTQAGADFHLDLTLGGTPLNGWTEQVYSVLHETDSQSDGRTLTIPIPSGLSVIRFREASANAGSKWKMLRPTSSTAICRRART